MMIEKETKKKQIDIITSQPITIVSDAYRLQPLKANNNKNNSNTNSNSNSNNINRIISIEEDDNNNNGDEAWNNPSQLAKIKEIFSTKYIKIDIGGKLFFLSLTLLRKYPNSIIYKDYQQNQTLFYDRNPSPFKLVIEILRSQCLLHSHKVLDPKILQQIVTELHYYNFIQDLPQVIAILSNDNPIGAKGWFIKKELESSFQLLSTHPDLFQYEVEQCYSFIKLKTILTKEVIRFQFSIDSNINHKCVYIGLINEQYSEGISPCICKAPLNAFCLFSNGTIGIHGEKLKFIELLYNRAGTVYDIVIDLSQEKNRTILFTKSNVENSIPFSLIGKEFYLIWGACSGKGGCSLIANNEHIMEFN